MQGTQTTNQSKLFCAIGSETSDLSEQEVRAQVASFLDSLGDRDDVLLLPPDFTRFHSQAGMITRLICDRYKERASTTQSDPPSITIMPALGTHAPMTDGEIRKMFGDTLADTRPYPFVIHDWRNDVETIGTAPSSMVSDATGGMVDEPWPAQLNRLVWSKRKSLVSSSSKNCPVVISIGQVVPHEVMGMANYNKNLFVGCGGVDAINLSHFIGKQCCNLVYTIVSTFIYSARYSQGAIFGMEKMMGKKDNPLRSILNYASKKYLEEELDLIYVLTVIGNNKETGDLALRGLYIGRDIECYSRACDLSLRVNFTLVDEPVKRMVTYLDPEEFHSTWLGNKAIYRTRMAMADGGELIVLAPGLERFGEDATVDTLIRKYGYKGTTAVMGHLKEQEELRQNLSAVAHLIHVCIHEFLV